MKKKNYYLIALLATCFFTACEETEHSKPSSLSINVDLDQVTRASKNDFVSGDEIGIFVLNADGENYNDCPCSFNNKSTMSSGAWTLLNEVSLSDEEGKVYAYYPYTSVVTDLKQVAIESTSQTDYLVSTPTTVDATNPVATLRMRHALSLVKFVILKDGYSGNGHITGVTMEGIGLSGSLDISTGVVATTATGKETYKGDFYLSETSVAIGVIAIPQNVNQTTAIFTIDGEKYSYKLVPSNWQNGKTTTYTLKIDSEKKELIAVGSVTIDNWGNGESYEGNLTGGGIDIGTEI